MADDDLSRLKKAAQESADAAATLQGQIRERKKTYKVWAIVAALVVIVVLVFTIGPEKTRALLEQALEFIKKLI
jgi:hypothetical protein